MSKPCSTSAQLATKTQLTFSPSSFLVIIFNAQLEYFHHSIALLLLFFATFFCYFFCNFFYWLFYTLSQLQNKKNALEHLAAIIRKAFLTPKKRIKTKIPKKEREQRLLEKKQRGDIKKGRRKNLDE